jgi:hypothetical protein
VSVGHLSRAVGLFAVLWVARDGYLAVVAAPPWSKVLFAALAAGWLLAGVSLIRLKEVRGAAVLLIILALIETVVLHPTAPMGLQWFVWCALILAVAPDRVHEQAFLMRVLATVVYLTAAASKLNPPWLAGDSLAALPRTRTHLEPIAPLLSSDLGPVLAVLTIVTEASLIALLWLARTRRAAVAVGLVLHMLLVVLATPSFSGFINLLVLNGGLLVLYPAFFHNGGRWASEVAHAPPTH